MEMEAMLTQHRRALDEVTALVRGLTPEQLDRPSPCAGWDLRALLAHMIGQNHGFAAAVRGPGGAPVTAFAPRAVADDSVAAAWEESAALVASAFAEAPGERPVLLVEISEERCVPVSMALGFHLLDTVVHAWDVATSLRRPYRPEDDLVEVVSGIAAAVPTGPAREAPGAAFAPTLEAPADADPWTATLALLGRASSR
jgi:uncharacterized protein (TIGR03086 family)